MDVQLEKRGFFRRILGLERHTILQDGSLAQRGG